MSAKKLKYRIDGIKEIPLEQAYWQYLIDHAIFSNRETFIIRIEVKDYTEFYKHLMARTRGLYRNTEIGLINSFFNKEVRKKLPSILR